MCIKQAQITKNPQVFKKTQHPKNKPKFVGKPQGWQPCLQSCWLAATYPAGVDSGKPDPVPPLQ